MKQSDGVSACSWRGLLPAMGLALALIAGCGNEPDPIMNSGGSSPSAPAQVAIQDPAPSNPAVAPATPTVTPAPATADPAAPLNPPTVHKIIEDNITMREEIRRLKIERENLIRLLRAMGENYEPNDEGK